MSINPVNKNFNGRVGEECPICYVPFEAKEKLARLGCGHFFHNDCIAGQNICPIDRYEIKNISQDVAENPAPVEKPIEVPVQAVAPAKPKCNQYDTVPSLPEPKAIVVKQAQRVDRAVELTGAAKALMIKLGRKI